MRQATRQNTKFGTDPGSFPKKLHRMFHSPFVSAWPIQDFFPDPVGEGVIHRDREGIVGKLDHQGRGHIGPQPHRQDQSQGVM